MDEQKEKNYKVEWSFSFEKLGDEIADFVKSVGDKDQQDVKTGHFDAPIAGATSAQVRVDFSVGEATVTPLKLSTNLLEADLTYIGEVELTTTGDQERVVHLRHVAGAADWARGAFGGFGRQRLRWDIALTPTIPLSLDFHGGAGRSNFDLSALQLTALNIGTGVGEATIRLASGKYSARIGGGVGRSSLTVPAGADIDLNVSSGAGEVNLDIEQGAALNARISGGVGACNVRVPAGAAVRLEARTGIGSINAGAMLKRISSNGGEFWDKGGVWETVNFEDAERQIVIRFEGGVGALTVR